MDALPFVDFVLVQAAGVTSSPFKAGSKAAKQQAAEDRQLADELAHLAKAGNITLDVLAMGSRPRLDPCLSELCRGTGGSINLHSSKPCAWPMVVLPLSDCWLQQQARRRAPHACSAAISSVLCQV